MGVLGKALRILGLVWITVGGVTFAIGVAARQAGPGFFNLLIGVVTFALGKHLIKRATATPVADSTTSQKSAESLPEPSLEIDEEALWAQAFAECEGQERNHGVWAKALAESDGNVEAARAKYLKVRFQQLRERQARQAESAYLATLSEEALKARQERLTPKAACPCCEMVIPLTLKECPRCKAQFGEHSAWKLEPVKK